MKMHRISKRLGYQTSYRFCGALFCVAAFSLFAATIAQGQTKSITPDPYFGSSQPSTSAIKKPSELSGDWKAPTNFGITGLSSSASQGSGAKPQAPSQLSGLGLSAVQKPVASSTNASATDNSFSTNSGSTARTANAGSQSRNLPEASSKPRPKSLIVHADGASANQGSGSRSSIKQVGHDSDTVAEPFKPGKVLALVGGEPIFVGDLMFKINQIIEEKMAGAPEKIKEQQRQMAIPQLLPSIVESKLLYQGALRSLPDEVDMEGIFAQVEKQFEETDMLKMMESAGVKTTAEFDARLRGQDYSLRQLKRSWAIQQFTRHSIGQTLGTVAETTHQEMLDRYKKNLASYEKPARAKWEEILIRFDRTGSRAETKRAIVEIGNQVVHGANFAATAKKQSHGFNAASGGQHDWTTQGALALDKIDEAIFSLPVGELSDLIETQRGFHIVRVIERTPANRTPFLEAQMDIKKKIEGEKRKAAFEKYAAKLREEIPVEYLINE